MTSPFEDPATPSGIEYGELNGSLLMIQVLSLEDHVPTVNTVPGEKSPAVRANVTVIDGPHAGHVYEDALIFPKVLQSQLRSRIGKVVLGRLGQGDPKPGQTAPWKLAAATDSDKQRATTALSVQHSGGPVASNVGAEPPF